MKLNIAIWEREHRLQRYNTVGDYYRVRGSDDGVEDIDVIAVSELSDRREMLLIAIHELIEMALCQTAGVTNEEIDKFDMSRNISGEPGNHDYTGEPGDDPNAPYYRQHQIATGVERLLAAEMHVNWNTYEQHINALSQKPEAFVEYDDDIPF